MPQALGSSGGQAGTGIALVLAVMVALAGVVLTKVVAMAPVTARAITRLRTMTFMVVYSPFFGYSGWVERKDFSGLTR